jgi:hypothetical protein
MEARKGTTRMQVDDSRVAVERYLTGKDFIKYVEIAKKALHGVIDVKHFDFEACLRVSAFQFTRGSAIYRE